MASVPAHIKTARKQGAIAGVQQLYEYLDRNTNGGTNGLEQAQEMLAEVRKAGGYRKRDGVLTKPEKAAQWYCNHFSSRFNTGNLPMEKPTTKRTTGGTRTTTARGTTRKAQSTQAGTDAPNADLMEQFAQFQEFLKAQAGTTEDADVDDEYDDDDTNGEAIPARSERRNVRNVRRQAPDRDTAQAYPPPRDPDSEATSGKLWKLNAEGPAAGIFLCVIDGEGNILAGGESPITAGEAYDLIGEHIA